MAKKLKNMKRLPRFTHQSAYKEYAESVKMPLPYPAYDVAISQVLKKLSAEIIVNKYEFKMPFLKGFVRISKNAKGFFYWYWDRLNSQCRLKARAQWTFTPARGNIHEPLGVKGLTAHYYSLKNNPRVADYDVPRRVSHGKKLFWL